MIFLWLVVMAVFLTAVRTAYLAGLQRGRLDAERDLAETLGVVRRP